MLSESTSSLADASPSNVELGRLDVPGESKKKKKKKRSHDEAAAGDDVDSGNPKKKKKKKRKHTDEVIDESAVAEALLQVAAPDSLDGLAVDLAQVKKKKKDKKHKDKRKSREVHAPQEELQHHHQTNAEMDDNAQSSTNALLNAIVAAVTGAPPQEGQQAEVTPQEFHPVLPPSQMVLHPPPPPFMPFPLPPGFVAPGYGEGPINGANFIPNLPPHIFNDLAYGSPDDIIRALQDLDVSKLAGVLKTLGDAATAANVPNNIPSLPLPPAFIPQPLPPPPAALKQTPAGSSSILGRPGRAPASSNNRTSHTNSVIQHQTQNNHADTLCTKWLSAAKLAELVETEGLVYKKGKFSATEDQQIAAAMETYRTKNSLTQDQILELIFSKNDKQRNNYFWTELTRAVTLRPIIAVYHHVRRTHHPLKQQGTWSADEDLLLKQAVTDLGQQWEKVSGRVGRMSSDCRDRYRNHLWNREVRVTGTWSKEEEEELTRIVTDMTISQGRDIDNDVFWGRVSQLMGGRRGRQQCRIKWTDSLSKIVKSGEGSKPRWSQQDAYILVHKVDSLNVNDDTEIDWKTLPDTDWNLWSAHTLQRRWLTMKKSIRGYEDMSHQEIMDILRVKKAHTPEVSTQGGRKRKARKIVSATTISEEGPGQVDQAGSSTGPGTLGQM